MNSFFAFVMPSMVVLFDRKLCVAWLLAFGLGAMSESLSHAAPDERRPFGLARRVPWTNSQIMGSPEPSLPYKVEKVFPNISWKAPIFVTPEPDTDRLFIIQGGGEKDRPSRILALVNDPRTAQVENFLVISNRLIYSITFHPGYATNGRLFVFSHGVTGELARTNRVSYFTVDRQGTRACDPQSERVVLDWNSEGHDGGGLVFGHDRMLYISTGDGTSDSDRWVTGQDLNDLLGAVLRINADRADGARPYSIPKDNPFVGWTNARPELWAYGLRNPWRLCMDQKTGRIWAGNNGQDLWETAHLIRRGENYGWSVYEGSHPFYLNRRLGPSAPVLPTIEHSHAEFRSLTGGVVYYGEPLQELEGFYIYGDYSTGEIWGARHDGSRMRSLRRLARTQIQISSFAVDRHGQLLITDHGGGLYRLARATPSRSTPKFPTRLSQTGLFLSTKEHRLNEGVIPYSVVAPAWADGAKVERFMALPESSRIGRWTNGAVLFQTLSLEQVEGRTRSARRVETRLLHFENGQWAGYSYRWNKAQSDATLVGAEGDQKKFVITDNGEPATHRGQTWRFPSRTECMTCHSRAASFVLGLNEAQLNRDHDYREARDNQLRTLQHIGLFTGNIPKPSAARLVDPYNVQADLEARARSYLHVNCAVCHVDAGGGNAKMELGLSTAPDRMNLLSARPQHDTFGIDNAMLVFPGDPNRSILCQRLARRGRGQMPPLVSTRVDEQAVALFTAWIASLKPAGHFVREWTMDDLVPTLDRLQSGRSFETGKTVFRQVGCSQCHRLAEEGGGVGPDLNGVGRRLSPRDLLESLLLPSKVIAPRDAVTEIETQDGVEIAGRVEREDERVVVIRPATATEEMITLRKKEIRRRGLSTQSNMPAGILNSLEEEQILDLMSYIIADGKPEHSSYK